MAPTRQILPRMPTNQIRVLPVSARVAGKEVSTKQGLPRDRTLRALHAGTRIVET